MTSRPAGTLGSYQGTRAIGDAAHFLGVSKGTLSRMCDRGEIPYWITPGRHRRFAEADLYDAREKMRHHGVSAAGPRGNVAPAPGAS